MPEPLPEHEPADRCRTMRLSSTDMTDMTELTEHTQMPATPHFQIVNGCGTRRKRGPPALSRVLQRPLVNSPGRVQVFFVVAHDAVD